MKEKQNKPLQQRLEELLYQWKEENPEQNSRKNKELQKKIIKALCIITAILGPLWPIVRLSEWYWNRHKLNTLAAAYFNAAETGYQQTRDPDVALEIINKALELSPNNPEFRYKQIYYRCHVLLKQLPTSRNLYTAEDLKKLSMLSADLALYKKLFPDDGELLLLEAMLFSKAGKYQQAVNACKEAADKGAEYPYTQYIMIQNLISMNKIDAAAEAAAELQKKYQHNKYSHAAYAMVLQRQYRFLEASQAYQDALALDPVHYESLMGYAGCTARIIPRNYPKERAAYQKVLSFYHNDFAAHSNLVRTCIAEGNYPLASLYLKKAERLFANTSGLHALQAELYLKERNFRFAEKASLQAFQENPEDINIQRQLVTFYIATGNFKQAVEYNRIIMELAIQMDNPGALNNAAWRFYLLGTEYDKAETAVRQAIKKRNNSFYYGTLSSILLRQGKSVESLAAIDKAIALAGKGRQSVHMVAKALILIELKRNREALELIQQTEKAAPGYYRLYLALGKYHLLAGNPEKAAQAVADGSRYTADKLEKSELQMLSAQIHGAAGNWQQAQLLQKQALANIDNNFNEIRIAYQKYAGYSLKAGDKAEAEKALTILKSIDARHPDILKLEQSIK